MRKTSLFALVAVALTLSLAVSNARAATVIYSADFNSAAAGHTSPFNTPAADYANGNLATSATAGQNTWVNSSGLGTNALLVSGNDTNGTVAMTTTGEDDRATFTTIPAAAGTSYYLSADITLSAVGATGDYFFNIGDGGASNFDGKVFAKSSGSGYVFGASVNTNVAAASFGSGVLAFNGTHHIVMEYDSISGTANDTVELYVDPATDPSLGGVTPYVSAAATANDLVNLGAVYLRQGSGGPALVIDNILLTSAPTVPEPASLVLCGLGMIGLVSVSRNRSKR